MKTDDSKQTIWQVRLELAQQGLQEWENYVEQANIELNGAMSRLQDVEIALNDSSDPAHGLAQTAHKIVQMQVEELEGKLDRGIAEADSFRDLIGQIQSQINPSMSQVQSQTDTDVDVLNDAQQSLQEWEDYVVQIDKQLDDAHARLDGIEAALENPSSQDHFLAPQLQKLVQSQIAELEGKRDRGIAEADNFRDLIEQADGDVEASLHDVLSEDFDDDNDVNAEARADFQFQLEQVRQDIRASVVKQEDGIDTLSDTENEVLSREWEQLLRQEAHLVQQLDELRGKTIQHDRAKVDVGQSQENVVNRSTPDTKINDHLSPIADDRSTPDDMAPQVDQQLGSPPKILEAKVMADRPAVVMPRVTASSHGVETHQEPDATTARDASNVKREMIQSLKSNLIIVRRLHNCSDKLSRGLIGIMSPSSELRDSIKKINDLNGKLYGLSETFEELLEEVKYPSAEGMTEAYQKCLRECLTVYADLTDLYTQLDREIELCKAQVNKLPNTEHRARVQATIADVEKRMPAVKIKLDKQTVFNAGMDEVFAVIPQRQDVPKRSFDDTHRAEVTNPEDYHDHEAYLQEMNDDAVIEEHQTQPVVPHEDMGVGSPRFFTGHQAVVPITPVADDQLDEADDEAHDILGTGHRPPV